MVTALRPRSIADRTLGAGIVVFFVCFCVTIVYPFWNIVLTSFSTPGSVNHLGFRVWMAEWTLRPYRYSLSAYGNIVVGYANSVLRVFAGTALTIAMTFLFAYPLSKRDLPGRSAITMYIVITMFFSGGLIPLYLLVRKLGLMDTRLSLILPLVANGFYIIIMRNFLMTIDAAYEESAMIDGAGYPTIATRIVLPLSKAVTATIALWTAVAHWNEWFFAMLFIDGRDKWVLQYILRRMLNDLQMVRRDMVAWDERVELLPTVAVRSAMTVLTIGPIILVYPFLQRFFIKGVFVGSLKG